MKRESLRKVWYMRFDCADWIAGTITMTPEERGAYISLLAWGWQSGAIPTDERVASLIAVAPVEVTRRVLASKFVLGVDGWRNPRMEVERERSTQISAGAVTAAARRWSPDRLTDEPESCDRNASAYATASNPQCDRNASQSQSQSQSQRRKRSVASNDLLAPDAVQFRLGILHLPDEIRTRLTATYPTVDLSSQLASMEAWLAANPRKARKRAWLRFVTAWLARSAEDSARRNTSRLPVASNF